MPDVTLIQDWLRSVKSDQQPRVRVYSQRQTHTSVWFMFKHLQFQTLLCQCMHQNGLTQSVSQLALQARVRARARRKRCGRRSGAHHHRQKDGTKGVCGKRSSVVIGYTASSSNPAGHLS